MRSLSSLIAVLAGLLVLTGIATMAALSIDRERTAQADRRSADAVAVATGDFRDDMLAAVEGLQGLFAASRDVSPAEFERFAEVVLDEAGITAVSYLQYAAPGARPGWERRTGLTVVDITGGRSGPGAVIPLRYRVGNAGTDAGGLGVDFGSDPERRAALDRARDTGRPQATRPVRIVRLGVPGVNVFAPLYRGGRDPGTVAGRRRELIGFVGAVQRTDVLRQFVTSRVPSGTRFAVTDGPDVILGSGGVERDATEDPVAVAGRAWVVHADSGPHSVGAMPFVTAGVGLLAALAISALLWMALRREDYAQRQVLVRMLEREVAEEAMRRSADEQKALLRIATAVAADRDMAAVCEQTATEVATRVGADRVLILRLGEDLMSVDVLGRWRAGGGPAPEVGTTLPLQPGVGSVYRAFATRQAARTTAAQRRAAAGVHDDDPCGLEPFPLTVAAPVVIESRVWGFILAGVVDPLDLVPDAEERLESFAAITALAINSAESRERLAALASTDHLTGLPNRRAFHDRLDADLARVRRTGEPLSLIVIDVDHFKRVNDGFGHEVGDHVLVEFARRLRETARAGETVARVGGEEFAWIIPRCDGMDALRAVERARSEIARRSFPVVGHITASAGVCDLEDAEDAAELYRRADMALYWAKSSGRNRSFRFSEDALGILGAEPEDADVPSAEAATAGSEAEESAPA